MKLEPRNNLYWKIRVQRHTPSGLLVMYRTPRNIAGHKAKSFASYKCSKWGVGFIKKLPIF